MKIKIYLIALLSIIFASPIPAVCQTIFEWDFESGGNSWLVEGAIRESGEQATLPDQCLSGNNCAGFIINAGGCDSDEIRLVSPEIKLPEARIKSELHLAFRHALRLSSISDYGAKAWIQISVDNGEWQTIFGPFVGNKPGWTDVDIDISIFRRSVVRIGFYLKCRGPNDDGFWCFDDICVKEVWQTNGYIRKLITENPSR